MINAKFEDGKYYGAFISRVNVDGTYMVYFVDDSTVLDCVAHKDIKTPLTSDRQKNYGNWSKYKGKVFYEAGKNWKGFKPGRFVVKEEVVSNNNYRCCRVGSGVIESAPIEIDIGHVIHQIRVFEEE